MSAHLTLLEAAKRTENRLFQGLALGIVTTDQLGAMIPFRTFTGQAMTYMREVDLGETGFIPDDGTMGTPSTGTDTLVTVPVRRIGRDLDIDSLAADLDPSATGHQVMKKAKATWRLIKTKMVSGTNVTSFAMSDDFAGGPGIDALVGFAAFMDTNRQGPASIKYVHSGRLLSFRAPGDKTYGEAVAISADGNVTLYSHNKSKWVIVTIDESDFSANGVREMTFASSTDEFDGMNQIVAPGQVISSEGANGDALTFSVLDRLMDAEKVEVNRAFIMNSALIRKFLNHLRSTGGATPDHIRLPGHSGETITYRGVPILKNDNIPSTEAKGTATTLSSIYLASLDTTDGLFLGVPGTGLESRDVEGDPRRENVMGWRIEQIGALEGKAHRRTRVQWYGALGLGSELALARASEIITTE